VSGGVDGEDGAACAEDITMDKKTKPIIATERLKIERFKIEPLKKDDGSTFISMFLSKIFNAAMSARTAGTNIFMRAFPPSLD
jgi:hypothetical protein